MRCNNWVKLIGTVAIALVLIVLIGLLTPRSLASGWRVVIEETILFAGLWGLNRVWLKQPVYFRLTERNPLRLLAVNWVSILLLIMVALMITSLSKTHHVYLGLSIIMLIFVPVAEEYLARGLVLPLAFSVTHGRHQLAWAVALSGLTFGLLHSVNLFHQSLSATGIQMLYTFCLGVMLAAIYLRSGSLLMPMLLHGLNDFIATYTNGLAESKTTLGRSLPVDLLMLMIGIILLRKSQQHRIKLPFAQTKESM
ncbi:CPBP family intramembrane glutamic endopeptidase [Furfurilactobacillus siliginis]|uniref:CAAX prenyl protease 2/Lysostaphin resistance protein A-like domain-containing protein n=1 Tax=Furfurilactobacillus siliginis TaxID=348151 RepID=A0A0R2L1Q2_9LACO|nr:CPBP family intramembrane glutamic endopeptidase [Furfurilactobacillus siliginis]KRN93766.1 hypothetical protein IV55_GL000955 [Furfurilactobacillus siliginis]GEK28942.1 hypothetical protein LSI01_12530 [Furfurilactobacillus siliginis]